jgi:hypothetical protein
VRNGQLYVVQCEFAVLPASRCFALQSSLLRWAGANVGANVHLVSSAPVDTIGGLTIGQGQRVRHESLIVGPMGMGPLVRTSTSRRE